MTPSRPVDTTQPAYYDPTAKSSPEAGTLQPIPMQKQSTLRLHNLPPVPRKYPISSSFPEPYYDPSGPISNAMTDDQMYVVPVNLQDDLRDEENSAHKYLREGLK